MRSIFKGPQFGRRPGLLRWCLCLALAGSWCAAGRPRAAAAQSGFADSAEAQRLDQQLGRLSAEGRYTEAIPVAERALAAREQALGPASPHVAASLNNLALLHRYAGDYARAEPLYERALAIFEKALGAMHPEVANVLTNLAGLHRARADYARAAPLLRRALAIREKALGADHPLVALSLNNLAELHRRTGEAARAEPLYRRALAILERALGPDHPHVATALNNLAQHYRAAGDYARAEPLYRRAQSAFEKALGPDHPLVASSLANLAGLYEERGDHARAERHYLRALALREKAAAPPGEMSHSLYGLASLNLAKGDYARAVQFMSRGQEVSERHLALVLSTGSERQKLLYLQTEAGTTHAAVSLHARYAPADPQARRLSLTAILRRKGRALDAMTDQVASLRRRLDPQDQALLAQLSAAQTELAALVLGGPDERLRPGRAAAVARLEEKIERLEDAIGRRSAEFRVQTRPVTMEAVRRALPPHAALVEFFSYRPIEAKATSREGLYGPERYVAYVLRREGEPEWADLGPAAEVEAAAARLLAALRCLPAAGGAQKCPAVASVKQLARALDERVMRPVRRLLGGARHVLISPDGALNLIPFAALVDENEKYLIESYSLTYLTSGRDLLRLELSRESRQPPLIMGDPLFGPAAGATPPAAEGGSGVGRSGEMGRMRFGPLPGTAAEAEALGAMLPGARVLTRGRATEAALKQTQGPRLLHVATHGFFLPDQPREAAGAARGLKLAGVDDPPPAARFENPLLRSGLALEGANLLRGAGGEDGILTAQEASALDLWGTKLVVLSACETGVGEVRTGEGVYGLRRALVLAGSESQLMSLWQVSDEATRDLMIGYFKRLLAGEGRAEALRQVQLAMLQGGAAAGSAGRGLGIEPRGQSAERSHPYFWAAFIQSGDWRAMSLSPR